MIDKKAIQAKIDALANKRTALRLQRGLSIDEKTKNVFSYQKDRLIERLSVMQDKLDVCNPDNSNEIAACQAVRAELKSILNEYTIETITDSINILDKEISILQSQLEKGNQFKGGSTRDDGMCPPFERPRE
jgi:hypothetical protein